MKALIVDDEKPARDRMTRLLQTAPNVVIIGEASNGMEALEKITELSPDVVFLDIDMPLLNGVETAAALQGHAVKIVFVTAYQDYALRAFDLHAVDYLVKPVESSRLQATLKKLDASLGASTRVELKEVMALLEREKPMQSVALKSGTRFLVFKTVQVSALIACDNYVEVLDGQQRVLVDERLDTLDEKLRASGFVRIHRSSLINLSFVRELRREGDRKYTAVLSDYFHTELAVSRENLQKLKDLLAAGSLP